MLAVTLRPRRVAVATAVVKAVDELRHAIVGQAARVALLRGSFRAVLAAWRLAVEIARAKVAAATDSGLPIARASPYER